MSEDIKTEIGQAIVAKKSIASELTERELDMLLELSETEYEHFLSGMTPAEGMEVTKAVQAWNKLAIHESCRKFRSQVLISNDGKLEKFTDIVEDWQNADFLASDPSWTAIIHGMRLKTQKYFWRERARGHSKTTDLAVMVLCALYSSPTKITGVAGAASKDQARIIRDSIDGIVRSNPWLHRMVDVQNYVVKNKTTGSMFEIISSDESTSYGKTVEFIICDELTHWKTSELWKSLFSTSGKKTNCILVVITNAGYGRGQSWQWEIREKARTLPNWHFSCLEGPRAKWITPQVLADQRECLTDLNAYRRLWENVWLTETGTGIDMGDVDECMSFHTEPLNGPEIGKYDCYIASIDLGLRHDFCGFVIVGVSIKRRKFRLAHCMVWRPDEFPGNKISPDVIQKYVWEQLKTFRCVGLVFDVWQMEASAEWIESQFDAKSGYMCPTYPYEQTPSNLSVMATTLIRCLRNKEIEMYPQRELRADFAKMSIKETMAGFRIQAVRDETVGHCDLGSALAMCLPFCDSTLKDYLGMEE